MNRPTKLLSRWIIALVSDLYFGADLIRSWLFYQDDPVFIQVLGLQALAFAVIYTAGSVFLGAYTLAIRRSQSARQRSQSLAGELQEANQKLLDYSARLEQLAIVRERNRLARELHDTVSQLIFSISLTTRSAQLLLEKDPARLSGQLSQFQEMTANALARLPSLITQLCPPSAENLSLI